MDAQVPSHPEEELENESHVGSSSQLANAFDSLDLESPQLYDVEGEEDSPPSSNIFTVADLRAANSGSSLRRKLLPFTTPNSKLSLGEEQLDLRVDKWAAAHHLDYIEVRGTTSIPKLLYHVGLTAVNFVNLAAPGASPLARSIDQEVGVLLEPHQTAKNFPGKASSFEFSLVQRTWRLGQVHGMVDIYFIVQPDPDEDELQRARVTERTRSSVGKPRTSVTSPHAEAISSWIAEIIGGNQCVQSLRSLRPGAPLCNAWLCLASAGG